jgi:hypothetical protein
MSADRFRLTDRDGHPVPHATPIPGAHAHHTESAQRRWPPVVTAHVGWPLLSTAPDVIRGCCHPLHVSPPPFGHTPRCSTRFDWLTMLNNCFRYYKGCKSCQKFGDVQLAPAAMLHPIIKPWPFRGWALDFIGQIHPASSIGQRFLLVAMDYFTKWMEAIPLKNVMHREVIHFILEHIVHRFGIPQTLTTDQGSSFMSHQVHEFAEYLKIKILSSSPYYAQANGLSLVTRF